MKLNPSRLAVALALVPSLALAACQATPILAPRDSGAQAAQDQDQNRAELAKKLANPVANLVSVPLHLDYDHDLGVAEDGERWVLNAQAVLPFEWDAQNNVISRTAFPLVHVEDLAPGSGNESGVGDILQSFYYSPKAPTGKGWIWGAGPALLLPTASDDALGRDKFGLGPTAVALRQKGPWTHGALGTHIWSVGGDSTRSDISETSLHFFANYTTSEAWTFTGSLESTFDWHRDDWSVPLNLVAQRLVKTGDSFMSIGGGLRFWLDSPDTGPDGVGVRLICTFVF